MGLNQDTSYTLVNHNAGCHSVVGFVLLLTDYGAAPRLVNHILRSCLSAGHLKQRRGQTDLTIKHRNNRTISAGTKGWTEQWGEGREHTLFVSCWMYLFFSSIVSSGSILVLQQNLSHRHGPIFTILLSVWSLTYNINAFRYASCWWSAITSRNDDASRVVTKCEEIRVKGPDQFLNMFTCIIWIHTRCPQSQPPSGGPPKPCPPFQLIDMLRWRGEEMH